MGTRIWLVVALAAAGVLAGCAAPATKRVTVNDALVELEARKQREIALETRLAAQECLSRVAYPLLRAAVPLCEDQARASIGAAFANKYAFPGEFADTAVAVLGVGEPLQFLQVHPGTPAERAGLQTGDILISVNGQTAPTGSEATAQLRTLFDDGLVADQPARFAIVRNDARMALDVTPERVCGYGVVLSDGGEVNAYADGTQVIITKGMLRFVDSDDELSLVVAHEIAHNAMDHMKAKTRNYVLGSVFDILAAAYGVNTSGAFGNAASRAYSQEFEAEADYVGLYLMARAGLEVGNSAHFWRRMAAEHPANIQKSHSASHPATPERFVAIESTVAEIQEKRRLGLPFELQYKEKAADDPAESAWQ